MFTLKPDAPPQTVPISVDFTAPLLTSVFSVGSLFHSQVERMFLLFAFLAITVTSLWRELLPCCDLASIPFISLLKVTCLQGGKSFLIPPRAWAFPTAGFLCVVGILQQLELQNKEVESVWETHPIEQDEARISREFLALQKCHLNQKLLFLICTESIGKAKSLKTHIC